MTVVRPPKFGGFYLMIGEGFKPSGTLLVVLGNRDDSFWIITGSRLLHGVSHSARHREETNLKTVWPSLVRCWRGTAHLLGHYPGALKAAVIERSGETGGGTPKSPCWKVKNHGRGRRSIRKRRTRTEGQAAALRIERPQLPSCRAKVRARLPHQMF